METILYAVGDVHGYDDLLEGIHERIAAYHQAYFPDCKARVIHIGDYIDGGPDSLGVLDRLIKGFPSPHFESICLKGNHEDMLLQCLETDDVAAWRNWLLNGGEATLRSLGISLRYGGYNPQMLAEALGQNRIEWLQALSPYYTAGRYLFVHAGIIPGIPLEEQKEQDMLWIRRRFLDFNQDHGYCVVHGHTPSKDVVIKHNRIGIDTGVHSNGKLSAVLLKGDHDPHVFTVEEKASL